MQCISTEEIYFYTTFQQIEKKKELEKRDAIYDGIWHSNNYVYHLYTQQFTGQDGPKRPSLFPNKEFETTPVYYKL